MNNIRTHFNAHFISRWTVACIAGWTLGLFLGLWNPICFAASGIVTGIVLGAAQSWARRPGQQLDRTWIIATVIGTTLGTLVAGLLFLVLLALGQGLALLVAGLILGLGVGLAQAQQIADERQAVLWVIANLGGGAVCGLMTSIPIVQGLPLGLVAGATVFGYLTGRVMAQPPDD